ncbi:MFS transporter [Acetobacterium wieringae]|uniref:Putative 3-hydroxyphenylpropionic transporter MhpT n=1 Tax=Acetobacterium wieringae TaxID=52694 RepID=A0A1F2PBZ3_9FIRM|nr:MFS transporter [Acetobacterium wieringae]OFV68939.1 putative 3-hydroxyphenylpropionic transporter MhpT [Acetobacterium wieringae]
MNIKSEKIRNTMLMVTLICVTIALMGDMVIIPVAGNIFEEYANANMAVLNFILSGPALIGAFSGLIAGKLMQYLSKKKLLLVSFAIFSVGAIFGYTVHDANYMAAMRVLVGIGMGMVSVIAMAIIADVFVDEDKRSSMVGVYNGGMAAVGAALGWISGFVATLGWTTVFYIYLVAIPILVMIIFFIPADKVTVTGAVDQTQAGSGNDQINWLSLMALCGAFLIFNIIYCIVYYKISMIVSEKAIGDVAFVGTLSALGTIGSFIACMFFGKYYAVLKRATPILAYVLMALCFCLLYFSANPAIASVACTLLGATYGVGISYYFMHCTMIVPESQIPISISFTSFAMSIGSFLSVYVAAFIQGFMGVETITEIMPILIGILLIGAVLSAILTIKEKKAAKL